MPEFPDRHYLSLEEAIKKYGHFDKDEWYRGYSHDNEYVGGDPAVKCWYCRNESLRYESYIFHRTEDLVAGPVGSTCILGFFDEEIAIDIQMKVKELENASKRRAVHEAKYNKLIKSAHAGPLKIKSDGMSHASIERLHRDEIITSTEAQWLEQMYRTNSTYVDEQTDKILRIARYQLIHPETTDDPSPTVHEEYLDQSRLTLLGYIRPPGFVHYCSYGHPSFSGMGIYTYPGIDTILALGERCAAQPGLSRMKEDHQHIDEILQHDFKYSLPKYLRIALQDLSVRNPVIEFVTNKVLNEYESRRFHDFSFRWSLSEKQQRIMDQCHQKIITPLKPYRRDPRTPFIPRNYFS